MQIKTIDINHKTCKLAKNHHIMYTIGHMQMCQSLSLGQNWVQSSLLCSRPKAASIIMRIILRLTIISLTINIKDTKIKM